MTENEVLDLPEQLPGDTSELLDLPGESSAAPETIVAEVVEPDRLFLSTPFEEYTVTEGLLLMLLLLAVAAACVKLVKGGFSWL